ncbi:MAG: N-formylglutamate amidohydrolase [Alphaproteobacteria bacterium]|nr:N-formylglutamate amidohydrolase [Alphaproteobacteria bacterium]
MTNLLAGHEPHPAELINPNGNSPFVLICEHASNVMPLNLGTLGLAAEDLNRHIAYDIGAAGTAKLLARLLDAPLIMQRYSRLAYDCNRPPESPGAMPELSEIYDIPGNKNLVPAAKLARITEIYRPFQNAIAQLLDERAARGTRAIPISIHSFTKHYKGKDRAVELGLLFDRDAWLANQLVKSFPDINVQLNEPYGPKDGVMHLMNLHAAPRGLQHLMIEIRNDLIESERGQQQWAQRLSVPLMKAAAKGEKL